MAGPDADLDADWVSTAAQLAALLGPPAPAAIDKEVDHVHPLYRAMIEASPFAVLATHGPGGLDASPRGDAAGFVVVEDAHTLLLPERRGNNRADSLRNLVADPRVALLFLIPGLGETLRVNGQARIGVAPSLLDRFVVQGQRPACVLVIRVQTVFFQCARAIKRAGLWDPRAGDPRDRVPSPGTILQALSGRRIDGAAYDRDLPERQRRTLY